MFHKDGKGNSTHTLAESKEVKRLSVSTLQNLNEKVTEKIAEIVRRSGAGDVDYRGYDESEVASAKDLLAWSTSTTTR